MTTEKLIEILKQYIRNTYLDTCFRKQQCLDSLDLIQAKLNLCPKK